MPTQLPLAELHRLIVLIAILGPKSFPPVQKEEAKNGVDGAAGTRGLQTSANVNVGLGAIVAYDAYIFFSNLVPKNMHKIRQIV